MAWMHPNKAVLGGFKAKAEGEALGRIFRLFEQAYDNLQEEGRHGEWPYLRGTLVYLLSVHGLEAKFVLPSETHRVTISASFSKHPKVVVL
jgi:hypothetical protein